MRKSELSENQVRDLGVFNLILDCNGWADQNNTEKKLDSGLNVNPEGYRVISGDNTILQARFHAPVNMISLSITDLYLEEKVQFHFLFDNQPERVLEWLVSISDQLNMDTYPDLLKHADGKCEMILLEVSESEIYEVKPPASV